MILAGRHITNPPDLADERTTHRDVTHQVDVIITPEIARIMDIFDGILDEEIMEHQPVGPRTFQTFYCSLRDALNSEIEQELLFWQGQAHHRR